MMDAFYTADTQLADENMNPAVTSLGAAAATGDDAGQTLVEAGLELL